MGAIGLCKAFSETLEVMNVFFADVLVVSREEETAACRELR
jgi:hypothetical protein